MTTTDIDKNNGPAEASDAPVGDFSRPLGSDDPESQMDNENAICPYCLAKHYVESESYSERERKETCDTCGREYLQFEDFTVTHCTRPIPPNTSVSGPCPPPLGSENKNQLSGG